jgi:hypothetical protein
MIAGCLFLALTGGSPRETDACTDQNERHRDGGTYSTQWFLPKKESTRVFSNAGKAWMGPSGRELK